MNRLRQLILLGVVVLLPLPAFAQGSIVFVNPPDFLIQQDDTLHSFDLNGDGSFDLGFRNLSDQLDVIPAGNNQVSATANPPPESGGRAVPIPLGGQINAATAWQGRYVVPLLGDFGPMLASNRGSPVVSGPFAGLDGYLGVRFFIGTELHYGWVRLNLNNNSNLAIGFVTEWAYNSVPGEFLAAGVVPEPSTLALVALGAGGLLFLRRCR